MTLQEARQCLIMLVVLATVMQLPVSAIVDGSGVVHWRCGEWSRRGNGEWKAA